MSLSARRSFVPALLLLGACTAPPSPPDGVDMAPPDISPPPAPCADDGGDRARGGTCVREISGRVVDYLGNPVRSMLVGVCADLCIQARTQADGSFKLPIYQYLRTDLYALGMEGNPYWSAYYLPMPALDAAGFAHLDQPFLVLPMPTAGPQFRLDGSAQTLSVGGVTLSVPAGTSVLLSLEDARDSSVGTLFRPLRVTMFSKMPFLGDLKPVDLYGFGPFEVVFSGPVQLTLPNTAGLPAGTAVELMEEHGLLGNTPPGWAWKRAALAHVTTDGQRITMDAGNGVTTLTWLAVRKLAQ